MYRTKFSVPGRAICLLTAAILILATTISAQDSDKLVLVRDGEPRCVVVSAPEPDEHLKFAIDDLVRCVEVMSGTKLQIISNEKDVPANFAAIRIGLDGGEPFLKTAGTSHAFVLRVSSDKVIISGSLPTASGTMFGVYDFLEELGVRWFMPGELGEIIPQKKTVAIKFMEKLEKPDFVGRRIQFGPQYNYMGETRAWEKRVKLWPYGVRLGDMHTFKDWIPATKPSWYVKDKTYFEEHPEYFSLVKDDDGELKRMWYQLCTSNPEVVRIFSENIIAYLRKTNWDIVPIGPNDGGGFCKCGPCTALDTGDFDPYYNRVSVTDRLLVFFNQVIERVEKEFPDVKFSFLAYVNHQRVPLEVRPHPKLIVAIAPIRTCVIHGPQQLQCPGRSVEWTNLLREWGELASEVWSRDYGLPFYGQAHLPIILTHRFRTEIPTAHKLGVKGYNSIENWISWAGQMLDPYLMAKLWWDADTDVDALIEEYFSAFFGSSAEPMKRYWKRMDDALAQTPYHSFGIVNLDIQYWYPLEVVEAGTRDLEEAADLASTEKEKQRVAMIQKSHQSLVHFLQMHDHMKAGRFVQAAQAYQKVHDLGAQLTQGDPQLVDPSTFHYIYQDWDQSSHSWAGVPHYSKLAAQRVSGGNQLVAMLPQMWLSQIDPLKSGETQRWYDPEIFSPLDWIERDTYASARSRGLANYKGDIWYRCVVEVPKAFTGRTIKLYFAGIRYATVWVNGQKAGKISAIQPREIDISKHIVLGGNNQITVRTSVTTDNHGIFRPAFLWSPR